MKNRSPFEASFIAPCGINCGVCIAHLRQKNKCDGCNSTDGKKANHCLTCVIKNCKTIEENSTKLCYECDNFPCTRMKQLDKRYRTKYYTSLIENLENIKALGMSEFLENELEKWTCKNCGSILSIHREDCLSCNAPKQK